MSFKGKHLEEDIKREISYIIRNLKNSSLKSKHVNLVKVKVNGGFVKVYVSSLKGLMYAKQSIKCLNNALGFIRHELSKNSKLKKQQKLNL